MARLPRFVLPGHPQHVILRGNNRQKIFRSNRDFLFFLEKLSAAADKHECDIHAYVLMPNHIHLLVTPYLEDSISKMMQMLGRYYVQFFNYRYHRTGTLWEGRYKASLIDSERYLLTCMRYIELNPVRSKGLVADPSQYPWSSYRCNALGHEDPLVTPHPMYQRLGSTKVNRLVSYRELFLQAIPREALESIRSATNTAWVLGDMRFRRLIEKQLNRRAAPKPRGGDRKSGNSRK